MAPTLTRKQLLDRGWTPRAISDWLLPLDPEAPRPLYLESDARAFEATPEFVIWRKGQKAKEEAKAKWLAAHTWTLGDDGPPSVPSPSPPYEPFQVPVRVRTPDVQYVAPVADGSRYPLGRELAWYHQDSDSEQGLTALPLREATSRGSELPEPCARVLAAVARARVIRTALSELSQHDQVVLHVYYSVGRKDPQRELVQHFRDLFPVVALLYRDDLDSLYKALKRTHRSRSPLGGDDDRVTLCDASREATRALDSAHSAYARAKGKVVK